MNKLALLVNAMIEYERGVPRRVGHFLKVYGYAKTIGELEKLPENMQFTLEAAAIVHDIGIKPSLEKYGSSEAKYQEKEGGAAARIMLEKLDFAPEVTGRVVFLVEHHHTYDKVDALDYQILLEADFLVNAFEKEMQQPTIEPVYHDVFKTTAGKRLCELLYLSKPAGTV